jgi:hypothetical protein
MVLIFIFITFFGSVDREPYHALGVAPSLAVCQEKAAEVKAQADKDPEVSGYIVECRTVPTKS